MTTNTLRTVLMVSYESGDFASCPAEWADDKVDAMLGLGYQVVLLTSPGSRIEAKANLEVIKVPSLSWFDYRDEVRRERLFIEEPRVRFRFFSLLAATFGVVFDGLFRLLAGNLSWGRYSWTVTATPKLIWLLLKHRNALFFATGGPSSAQLSAVIAGKLMRNRPILEFQDPIVGTQMSMSPLAWKVLVALERFLLTSAKRAFFVTRLAAEEARNRHPGMVESISHLYPGARFFDSKSREVPQSDPEVFELVHMGSLYGSRNLDNLFSALDNVYESSPELRGKIRIKNIGNLAVANKDAYVRRQDFLKVDPLARNEAIRLASESDALLLVQHTDDRSETTIPYKTYDYLNMGIPVIGFLRNAELESLITLHGGLSASNVDLADIEQAIRQAIAAWSAGPESYRKRTTGISISDQVRALLEGSND